MTDNNIPCGGICESCDVNGDGRPDDCIVEPPPAPRETIAESEDRIAAHINSGIGWGFRRVSK